jgi:methyl-accepting chemotaxis protein
MIHNVKVGTKLIIGFLAVAAIAASIGILGMIDTKKLDQLVDELYTKRLIGLSAVDDVALYLANIRVAVHSMPLADDEDFKEQIAAIEKNKRAIEEKMAVLDKALVNDSKGEELKRQIEAEYHRFAEYVDKVAIMAESQRIMIPPEYRRVLDNTNGPGLGVAKLAQELTTHSENLAKNAWEISTQTYDKISTILMLLVLAGVLLSIILGVYLSRSISKPLAKTVQMLNEQRLGHLGMRLNMNRDDEIGILAKTMDAFGDDLQNIVVGTMKQIASGDLSANIIPRDPHDEIAPALRDTIEALRGLIIDDGGKVLEAAAHKDLTLRLEKEYKGEYAKMKENINTVVQCLDDAMHQVSEAVKQVSGASSEISSGAQSLAEGANEQASSLEEVSSSLEEMSSMTKQNADNSNQAKILVLEAGESVSEADEAMKCMGTAIQQIKISSDNTAKILKTINDIAFQTNLLALNAAVEAARAGEAGKGFAVVAEEVRNLAMRSAEAAKNTADMIDESVKNAESGVKITENVAKALEKTVERAAKVSDLIGEIAAASKEQSLGVEQINTAVAQMNQVTQQNAANSEESASAAEELSSQAAELSNMVASFNLSGEEAQESAGHQHGKHLRAAPLKLAYQLPPKTRANMAALSADKRKNGAAAPAPKTNRMKAGRAEEVIPLDDDDLMEF